MSTSHLPATLDGRADVIHEVLLRHLLADVAVAPEIVLAGVPRHRLRRRLLAGLVSAYILFILLENPSFVLASRVFISRRSFVRGWPGDLRCGLYLGEAFFGGLSPNRGGFVYNLIRLQILGERN